MTRRFLLTSILFVFSIQVYSQIASTEAFLKEIHSQYKGQFCRHITYVQLNKVYKPVKVKNDSTDDDDSFDISTQYEAFEYPGKLRVDYGPKVGENGYIHVHDSIYYFKDGLIAKKERKINEAMLLTGDVYCITVQETISKLKELGYNLENFHQDVWKDNPVYVIGALKGDTISRQFWIDKKYHYLVRSIMSENGKLAETQLCEHQAKGKYYIEDEVKILENGKLVRTERYAEVNTEIILQPSVFDPKQWGKVHWKTK